jgi:hypothetical protein
VLLGCSGSDQLVALQTALEQRVPFDRLLAGRARAAQPRALAELAWRAKCRW